MKIAMRHLLSIVTIVTCANYCFAQHQWGITSGTHSAMVNVYGTVQQSDSDAGSHNGVLANADTYSVAYRPWVNNYDSPDSATSWGKVDINFVETDVQVKSNPFDSTSYGRSAATSNNIKTNFNQATASVHLAVGFSAPNTHLDVYSDTDHATCRIDVGIKTYALHLFHKQNFTSPQWRCQLTIGDQVGPVPLSGNPGGNDASGYRTIALQTESFGNSGGSAATNVCTCDSEMLQMLGAFEGGLGSTAWVD